MAIESVEANEMIVRCINELLGKTFIVRDLSSDSKMYNFLSRHLNDARDRLLPIGFDVACDNDAGVIMLSRSSDFSETGIERMNWRQFKKEQSKVLFVLLLMYSGSIGVEMIKSSTFGIINENINAYFPDLKMKQRKDIMKFLKGWKLIHFSGKAEKLGDDSEVLLLNSLAFCMRADQLSECIERIKPRVMNVADEDGADNSEYDDSFYDDEEEE